MLAEFIWRNCLIKELNIPDPWKNTDGLLCHPKRQDLFWVKTARPEVIDQLLWRIKDPAHKAKISEIVHRSPQLDYHFMISRDLVYIQYYPYLQMTTPGSLWQKINQVGFADLKQLGFVALVGYQHDKTN